MSSADLTYKVCIFGDTGVGKTSLTQRYLTEYFNKNIQKTLGVNIGIKNLIINDKKVALQIWDFGGEERYGFYLPIYAKGSNSGVFMFDITKERSLKDIENWLSIFRKHSRAMEFKIPILLVGGKLDLHDERKISLKEAKKYVSTYKLHDIIECSALTGQNVEKVFLSITHVIMRKAGHL